MPRTEEGYASRVKVGLVHSLSWENSFSSFKEQNIKASIVGTIHEGRSGMRQVWRKQESDPVWLYRQTILGYRDKNICFWGRVKRTRWWIEFKTLKEKNQEYILHLRFDKQGSWESLVWWQNMLWERGVNSFDLDVLSFRSLLDINVKMSGRRRMNGV